MPIMSYLAYPKKGRLPDLIAALRSLPGCEVHAPDGDETIAVLVTDTPSDDAEKALRRQLDRLPTLASLALVFAHRDDPTPTGEEVPR